MKTVLNSIFVRKDGLRSRIQKDFARCFDCKEEKEISMNTQTSSHAAMQKNVGRHVLVIGGSIGGLLSPRVLSDFFVQVTIVDPDIFPITPDPRKGGPQTHNAHALLPPGPA